NALDQVDGPPRPLALFDEACQCDAADDALRAASSAPPKRPRALVTATTGADGRASLTIPDKEGVWRVTHDGFAPADADLEIRDLGDDDDDGLWVELVPAGPARLAVVDHHSDAPVQPTWVAA